jgi:hypothetical protein
VHERILLSGSKRRKMQVCRLDLSGSRQREMEGSCDQGDEPLGSVEYRNYLVVQ